MKIDFSRVMALMARRYGDSLAVVNLERGRRYSFAAYHRLTNRIANVMAGSLGLSEGDIAMAIVDNDNLSLLHFPTAFKQAAVIAFTNVRESLQEHLWQVDLVAPRVVFLERHLLPDYYAPLRQRGCTMVAMDAPETPAEFPGVLSFWALVEAASDDDPGIEVEAHDRTAVLRFTGGTTGKGKCAQYAIDHFMATRDAANAVPDLGFGRGTRLLLVTPISHGALMMFWPQFLNGGTTYTLNAAELPKWAEAVEREAITHAFLVPTQLYRIADGLTGTPRDLRSLVTLIYGASPMVPARLAQLIELFGPIFVQVYGSTETIQFLTTLDKADHLLRDDAQRLRLGSAGRVVAPAELVIAGDDGQPLPPGQVGEVRLRSRATIAGYFRNPEATAREFQNGFWLSGDLGYLDEDGYLFLVDRKKDMIISGGFNIYPLEVEAALCEHPAVSAAAVVGIPHGEWGESVHAEVMLRPGGSLTPEALIEFARPRLAYKAPKSVAIVTELPLSSAGKVLRRVVREKYWAGRARAVN